MEKILFLAHTQPDGTLPKVALEAASAASDLAKKISGSDLIVAVIGKNAKAAVKQFGSLAAEKFLTVSGNEFETSRYSSDVVALEAIARQAAATFVMAPTTSRFSRVLPGVCQRLEGRIDTHVSGMDVKGEQLTIQRWYYRQRMMATLSRRTRPWFLVVDSGVFEALQGTAKEVAVEEVKVSLPQDIQRTKVTGYESAASGGAETIRPDAEILLVAGAGWTKKQSDGQVHIKEAGELILNFITKNQASLGSSKSLVDQSSEGQEVLSFMTHLNQVGQTGSTPRHAKGLSTCCHGEEPHVVGWRFINDRRAINLDPNCGWAQGKADVLYVADAFEVMAKINKLQANKSLV
ncbi:MAG: electron transfer flavoprotein subunit alpha [Candidatus Omnitrophica bacterium]|nr:electron transfer flavoprotein subunit alpha [Candidatus Omnitrophota bacterium]